MMALSFDSSDGGILSVDSHRVVPAPFLTKTYQLVDDHLTNDIVSWGEDGSTFVVWRPPEFARDLLPNYFKHNNFSSFVRQLNTYGFRKVVPDRWEFANDFFRKGERHLLCEIHRRKAQALVSPGNILHYGSSLSPSTSGEEHAAAVASGWSPLSSSPLPSPRASTTAAAVSVSLSDENERLRRDNCLLLSELARLQKLYDDAVMFLQQHMRLSSVDDLRLVRNHHQTSNGLQQLQRQFLLEPPRAPAPAPNENAEFCNSRNQRPCFGGAKFPSEGAAAAAPRASTIDFVDGKLRELAGNNVVNKGTASSPAATCVDQDDGKSSSPGPKLFGVVLHGRKRLHPEQQHQFHIEDSFPPAAKSAKTELDLMPHAAAAAATEAPWLRFRASRDERVCM